MFILFYYSEEVVCDEAELGPDEFAERMHNQHIVQEQVQLNRRFKKKNVCEFILSNC